MKTEKLKQDISRRSFTRRASTIATAAMIVPRYVLGGPNYSPPSEKLNIASIGVGGKGAGDVRTLSDHNIVALCDVDWERAAKTFKLFPKAKRYRDFRKMLEEMDNKIDAVTVSTPDHIHFPASMKAVQMKKHIYTQKPLTHSILEARKLTEAAREAGVATQMGIDEQDTEASRILC